MCSHFNLELNKLYISSPIYIHSTGPPSPPSPPGLMDITAVSMTINWTAGFNGGLQQTFTVLYKADGTDIEHPADVITEPEISTGDITVYKLRDDATIKPVTSYSVWIRTENSFAGGVAVEGNSTTFITQGKLFTSDIIYICQKIITIFVSY